jgi:hypothetical protein
VLFLKKILSGTNIVVDYFILNVSVTIKVVKFVKLKW